MAKLIEWICYKLGIPTKAEMLLHAMQINGEIKNTREACLEDISELSKRIDDLEAAYPDYKKAKAEADEKKASEIVPGFQPFSRRKRAWEAAHRKQDKK